MPDLMLCQKAAINIGLAASWPDFDRIQKAANSENSASSLQFTLLQLKKLLKEARRLKKSIAGTQLNNSISQPSSLSYFNKSSRGEDSPR